MSRDIDRNRNRKIILSVFKKNKVVMVLGILIFLDVVCVWHYVEHINKSVISTMLAFWASIIALWNIKGEQSASKRVAMYTALLMFIMAFVLYIWDFDHKVLIANFVVTFIVMCIFWVFISFVKKEEDGETDEDR